VATGSEAGAKVGTAAAGAAAMAGAGEILTLGIDGVNGAAAGRLGAATAAGAKTLAAGPLAAIVERTEGCATTVDAAAERPGAVAATWVGASAGWAATAGAGPGRDGIGT
jgi:hypothetical protein